MIVCCVGKGCITLENVLFYQRFCIHEFAKWCFTSSNEITVLLNWMYKLTFCNFVLEYVCW
jgi:hypothetical protein